MFGYIVVNKPEMKFREFAQYQSYYCGLCKSLKQKYGAIGQLTLSYDMTFLAMLLTGLYEPETHFEAQRCVAHPFEKHPTRTNVFTEYAADVNMLLTYYKCKDDWADEKKLGKYLFAAILRKKNNKIAKDYPEKALTIYENLEKIHECEKTGDVAIDRISGYFGKIMAELFVYQEDEWADSLRRIGFYLGKFIYLMDAYDDIEQDLKKGNYNPFANAYGTDTFEEYAKQILTMMMAECSREFETLPILQDIDILRNILYAGVWTRYEMRHHKRTQHAGAEECKCKEQAENSGAEECEYKGTGNVK